MKLQAAKQLLAILLVVVNYDVIKGDDDTLRLSTQNEECKQKQISIFTQLLLSEYKIDMLPDVDNLVVSSDVTSECNQGICKLQFSIAPTRCLGDEGLVENCDIVVSTEEELNCNAVVNLQQSTIRNKLVCNSPQGGSNEQLINLLLSKLLPSQHKLMRKRWGQMHGHVHPF